MRKHEQLNLFTQKLNSAFLVAADSPRHAFYRIWIENTDGKISVVKESGVRGRVLDRRIWPYADFSKAEKAYQRRIKAKTNPDRKSPRKYRLILDL
jgi:hypothetical protein